MKNRTAVMTWNYKPSFWQPFFDWYYRQFVDEIVYLEGEYSPKTVVQGRLFTAALNAQLPDMLKRYEIVICVSLDEILVPDPDKYQDLGDYLDKFEKSFTRTTGYAVLEMADDEPFDLSRKVTDQRSYWFRDTDFDKPILTRIPVKFAAGQHNCNYKARNDPDLYMFHLREADLTSLRALAPDRVPTKENLIKPDLDERRELAEVIPEKWRVI